jgi:hypothetical protein
MGRKKAQKAAAKEEGPMRETESAILAEARGIDPELSAEQRGKIMQARIGGVDEEFGLIGDRAARHFGRIGSTVGQPEFEMELGRERGREKARGAAEQEQWFAEDAMRRRMARAGIMQPVSAQQSGRFTQFRDTYNRQPGFDWGAVIGAGATAASAFICWIAEVLYGVDSWKVSALRTWFYGEGQCRAWVRAFLWFYVRYGERVAEMAKSRAWLRAVLHMVFDPMVVMAVEDLNKRPRRFVWAG